MFDLLTFYNFKTIKGKEMNVEGQSAIVTGGASGLGEATARLLAENGAKVTILDINSERGGKIAGEIGGRKKYSNWTECGKGSAWIGPDISQLRWYCCGISRSGKKWSS